MWWEVNREFYIEEITEESKKKSIQTTCPVCKTYLGQRWPDCVFQEHCSECKTTFTWAPKDSIPAASLDTREAKGCGCSSCRDRKPPKKKGRSAPG